MIPHNISEDYITHTFLDKVDYICGTKNYKKKNLPYAYQSIKYMESVPEIVYLLNEVVNRVWIISYNSPYSTSSSGAFLSDNNGAWFDLALYGEKYNLKRVVKIERCICNISHLIITNQPMSFPSDTSHITIREMDIRTQDYEENLI